MLGNAIADLVGGDAALAFDGAGGLVLEERSGRAFVLSDGAATADT